MKLEIKKMCKNLGFKGDVIFAKAKDFGTINIIKSVNQRVIDVEYDIEDAVNVAIRNNFEVLVFFLETPSFYQKVKDLSKKNKIWSEQEIIQIRKNIGYCSNYSQNAISHLLDLINDLDAKITQEQSMKGINYLNNLVFRKDGSLRKSKTNFLLNNERELHILKKFKCFKWVGVYYEQGWNGRVQASAPIYRVVAKNGEYFDYVAGSSGQCRLY